MNAGQLAMLIAAVFFAAGVLAAVYVLIKLAGLIGQASTVLTGYQDATDALLSRAQATVDRADEQLARTQVLSESVEAVSASMTDLSEQVTAVAGTARLIANGLGAPVLRFAAASHGVKRALAVRSRPGDERTARPEPGQAVMRRTFWLAAGALLGVVGYRRLDRTVRSITGPLAVAPPVRQSAGEQPLPPAQRSAAATALSATIWTARQIRSANGSSRATGAQVGAFLAEMRAGMAEYLEAHEPDLNRQHTGSGSTLVGQTRGRLAVPGRPAGALGPVVEGNRTHDTKDGR